jgi:hypothetical protein
MNIQESPHKPIDSAYRSDGFPDNDPKQPAPMQST